MTKTERTLYLLLYLLDRPRTFDELCRRFPYVEEQTTWRDLADVRRVAKLPLDSTGRYHVTRS